MTPFQRVVVINLDRRSDRLAGFTARAAEAGVAGWERLRAVDGERVPSPPYFHSGAAAHACKLSHCRALEDALMDGVESLLVLEDDCRFAPGFAAGLAAFLGAVPADWAGLMIGGQHHETPSAVGPGVVRATDCQRTHAYAVRGREAMRDLYKLWVRADRHIDHLFGHWQGRWPVYAPDPFLCGQDAGRSDISGHADGVRFWAPAPAAAPLYLLDVPKAVADELWHLGATWGADRDPRTGTAKALRRLAAAGWPAAGCRQWADELVAACHLTPEVPCVWPLPEGADFGRPTEVVRTESTNLAAAKLPGLLRRWRASRVTWLYRGEPPAGAAEAGWVTGRPATRQLVDRLIAGGRYDELDRAARQLRKEATRVRGGRPMIAHPDLDADLAMELLDPWPNAVVEAVGGPADWADQLIALGGC